MYQSIYVPVDNSAHCLSGADLAVRIARHCGARVTGSHVFAAALHDRRFRQMESGLPDRYLAEQKLVEQRDIHDELITRGLGVISDSYLDAFEARCREGGVACARVALEGKNWQRLVEDIRGSTHDLVIMGALGLGAVEGSVLGSVCERVARRIDRDVLVVKSSGDTETGGIVVAIDGSAHSFGALKAALHLARTLGREIEAVSAFDPYFHYVAFDSIAKVLSPAAASVFRFKEQEKLHEEIIDSGLAKIYEANLALARKVAAEEGFELKTTLLAGKPFQAILRFLEERRPWLVAMGRIGVHSEPGMDLGSNAENVLRAARCNVLLAARTHEPPIEAIADTTMAWTREADARMARIPEHARGMARKAVLLHAAQRGHTMVTSDVIDECLKAIMPPGVMQSMAAISGGRCPFAAGGPLAADAAGIIAWSPEAEQALAAIADAEVRNNERLRLEKHARLAGVRTITAAHVEQAQRAGPSPKPEVRAPSASRCPVNHG